MIDFTKYKAPGVYSEVVPGPQIGVNSTTPGAVGIVGDTQRFQSAVETLVLPASGASAPTKNQGVSTTSVVVSNPVTNQVYTLTTDYTVGVVTNGAGTLDDQITITPTAGGALAGGNVSVNVAYNYRNANFSTPQRFSSWNDVRNAYGPALDPNTGRVVSELSLAANFAFLNGAQSVVCVALDRVDTAAPVIQDYVTALDKLTGVDDISIVCSASGDPALHTYLKQHVNTCAANKKERRAIVGRDGTVTAVPTATRQSSASAIKDVRVAHVSPSTAYYVNPTNNTTILLGGQFLAAAVAGYSVSQPPQIPLTRKPVLGFSDVGEKMSESQMNTETQAGLMVVEKTRQGQVRVRHGVTTDPSNVLTREWNILGQQDALSYRVRDSLDNDQLIGSVINDLTLINVKASVDSALQSLLQGGTINDYNGLAVTQSSTSPDVIQVTFNWKASMPLNYIVAQYSIDMTTGSLSADATGGLGTN